MENSTYKNKYYEKSLYISLVFVSLLPLIIILGILILHFSEALDSLGYFLLICGSIFELVSLMLLLSSLTRRLVLFDDGFVWFAYTHLPFQLFLWYRKNRFLFLRQRLCIAVNKPNKAVIKENEPSRKWR